MQRRLALAPGPSAWSASAEAEEPLRDLVSPRLPPALTPWTTEVDRAIDPQHLHPKLRHLPRGLRCTP